MCGCRWLLVLGLVVWAFAWLDTVSAQDVPESREQIALSFAPLVKRVAPAVVNIFTSRVVAERPLSPFLNDPFFRRFFGRDFPFGRPRERVQNSLGSGVIVRAKGLIITNAHVIEDADQVTVVLSDRREFEAVRVAVDERTDLAVLRINPVDEALPHVPLADPDGLEVGDLVLAIGNPFGVGQTVTSGIVSALARTGVRVGDYNFFIQTDAAINPGNSGGALIDMAGRLVGINTAIYARRGGGSIGIGFAIPASMVRSVLRAVEQGRPVVRPWLGAEGQPVTGDIAQSLGLDRPAGVLVRRLHPQSPAAAAGLRVGDVITAVDGRTVDDPESLRFRIATREIGGETRLAIRRDGQAKDLIIALIAPPEVPPRRVTELRGRHPLSGATVANLSPALAEELDFDGPAQGVIVLDLVRRSAADRVGVRVGDIILQINRTTIDTVQHLRTHLDGSRGPWRLRLRRGDRVLTSTIR